MQFHRIQLIGPQDLPEAQDWALAQHDGGITLFIKEKALTPRCLEDAWAAYRLLTAPPSAAAATAGVSTPRCLFGLAGPQPASRLVVVLHDVVYRPSKSVGSS